MRTIATYILILAGSLLSGCAADPNSATSEKQALDKLTTPFEQGAITLTIQTDPDLNSLGGFADSCTLLVIQAQKTNTLNKLLSNPVQVKNLFSAAGAQDEILQVDRYPAMPGQSVTLHIDRSENSRYVAIVAGYYPFPQKQHIALVAIPVTTESTGWWSKTWHAQLTPLTLKLRLGSSSISQFAGAKRLPLSPTGGATAPIEQGN